MRHRVRTPWAVPVAIQACLAGAGHGQATVLEVKHDQSEGKISVFRGAAKNAILTQHARPGFRPYLHPIFAPDGKGVLTEFSPVHHRHQTGLYWGFTRLNGRDYFHHPGPEYWRRVSAEVLQAVGEGEHARVRWRTVYHLLGESGATVLTETQTWSMHVTGDEYVLDLEWVGEARVDVKIGRHDYGGLFLRMPWRKGIAGRVVNGARQRDARAEGQRAPWLDVGMQVAGRSDLAHIAILDHPDNAGYPQPWRVDRQMGVGPVRARLGDWHIAKGKRVVVRHRILVYTGKLDDASMAKRWSEFTGWRWTSAMWGVAQREGRQAEFLTPARAVARMSLPPGFEVNVFACEPMVTQPMAFCWDDRGRMWIAENRDYESRGRGFSRSGDSRILILEDTDRDGVADSRKVFLEGIPFPSALAVGFDGLWLGAPPNLLFVPDRNGDDIADEDDIEVRLTGWGIRDRHETLNSFHWGPDGWLYGLQGFATHSRVGKPAGEGRLYRHGEAFPRRSRFAGPAVDINGGVWRYHPTKERFEVVAHGFSNPWGIDYDAKGQLFISACVIPHLWHVIPGGLYLRQGGRHFNAYAYSDIRTIADHRHRSAHGGARVYLSDAFPARYRGRIFMANIHEHAVLTDVLEPQGSGFVAHHGDDFLLANNAQWIGFSLEIGPEGALYVLDWHDADICGNDVLHKETGRVFRITPSRSKALSWENRYADLAQLADRELVRLQRSASAWHARRARLLLQGRAAKGELHRDVPHSLRRMFRTDPNPDLRLRAMWTLHAVGGFEDGELVDALADGNEHVRAWAIQLLCEDRAPSAVALEAFASMAADDPSPVVRLYLAAALQRMDPARRWAIAGGLVTHGADDDDHNIPHMIWFGIEPLVPRDPERALELAASSRIPMIARYIARRLTDAGQLAALVAAIGKGTSVRLQLLLGMRDGLEGNFDATAPENWNAVRQSLQAGAAVEGRLAIELAQLLGDNNAAYTRLKVLDDATADIDDRRRALRGLARRGFPQLRGRLVPLLDVGLLRRDAIRAMAAYDTDEFARALLDRYRSFTAEEKLEAVQTLASRPRYGKQLTRAVETGLVPKRDVPAYVARQLRRIVGSGFVEVWGPLDSLPAETEAAFARFRALLTVEALRRADPGRGRVHFQKTCMACHTLHGQGGSIGPDLTGSNRTDLDYLLGNILTPSDVIQDDYRSLVVVTKDGRLYSGILAGENERQLRLHVTGRDEPVVIAKSAIESRELEQVSIMPEGLLRHLSDAEVLDLVAYLRTPEQVPLPPTGKSP